MKQKVNLKSLAEFKRFLGQPGATVQMLRNDWVRPGVQMLAAKETLFEAKTVQRLQSNGVQFSTNGWLYFEKADQYRFNEDEVTVSMVDNTFEEVIVYRCWLEVKDA